MFKIVQEVRRRGSMALLLMASCIPALAWAGPTPTARPRTEAPVQVRRYADTTAGARATRAARPRLTADAFRAAAARAKVSRLTTAAIETLKRLIRATPDDDPEKPDYYFRLAEHYREMRTRYMFRARELDEKIFIASQAHDSAHAASLKARQARYGEAERSWMLQAIKMYLRLAQGEAFSGYKRMDEVLFNVADMLTKAGRHGRARRFFGALIREHPRSKYIPDAYLSFAEHYFNSGKVEEALRLYEQVGKYPSSPLHGYALYKQGWCWLNLKSPRRALEKFVQVINRTGSSDTSGGGASKGKIILVREARKDTVRAFSHVGAPDKA